MLKSILRMITRHTFRYWLNREWLWLGLHCLKGIVKCLLFHILKIKCHWSFNSIFIIQIHWSLDLFQVEWFTLQVEWYEVSDLTFHSWVTSKHFTLICSHYIPIWRLLRLIEYRQLLIISVLLSLFNLVLLRVNLWFW